MNGERSSRRRFLAVLGASAAAVSGCGSDGDGPTPSEQAGSTEAGATTEAEATTATERPDPTETAGATEPTGTADRTSTEGSEPTETDESTETPTRRSFTPWPSVMRNDENWGHHPDADGPGGNVSVAWERDLDGEPIAATPVLADGRLFVGTAGDSAGSVYALDPESGETLWTVDPGAAVPSGAAVTGGFVYVGTAGGVLYALQADSGRELWHYDLDSTETLAPPTVVDGAVYVGSTGGRLYKFDALDSTQRWFHRAAGPITGPPAYVDGTVYAASRDGDLYAVSSAGDEEWTHSFGSAVRGASYRTRRLYATSDGGTLEQMTADGESVWSSAVDGRFATPPTVTGNTVLAGARDGSVHAFEVDSGDDRWQFSVPDDDVTAPVAVVDGTAYVGSHDGSVYGVDTADGSEQWSFATGGAVEGGPLVAGGRAFVGSRSGTVYALGE